MYRLPIFTGWCSTPNQLLICSSGVHSPEKHHGFGREATLLIERGKMTRIDLDKTGETKSQALLVSSQNSPSCDFLRFLFQPSWSNLWKKTANKNPLLFTKTFWQPDGSSDKRSKLLFCFYSSLPVLWKTKKTTTASRMGCCEANKTVNQVSAGFFLNPKWRIYVNLHIEPSFCTKKRWTKFLHLGSPSSRGAN